MFYGYVFKYGFDKNHNITVKCYAPSRYLKNEDSDECICLNFATGVTISSAYGKPSLDWGSNMDDCIQDTQITYDGDSEKNYTYHCGIDIFDNHVLRSKTSIPNYYLNGVSQTNFNTISDYLVDGDG